MDDTQLLAVIEEFEQESYGFASGELGAQRAYAVERYLAQPFGDEIEGRSQVVDTGLRDVVEWVMPQCLRVFLSGDEVVQFTPTSWEDEAAAKQETEYVNHVILEKNDAFNFFSTWFRDALMAKVGYVKAYWKERRDVLVETYRGMTEDSFALLLQDKTIQIAAHSEYPDPSAPQVPALTAPGMGGQAQGGAMPPPPMLHDVKVRRIQQGGFVKVDNVPPEEIYVHRTLRTLNMEDAVFVQHRCKKTLSELRQDGYDVPDDIFASNDDGQLNSSLEISRDRFANDEDIGDPMQSADPATRRLWVRESWVRADYDGDGVAELRKVCHINRKILANEETDLIPFAAVTPIVFPHRHVGIGYDDLCDQPSRIKTALVRGFLDNLYLANNGRYGINVNTVNVDDLLVSRPGGMVRVDGDPSGGIMPITHPVVGDAALQGLQWADSWRENSTGVSAYYQGLNADALNKTATGISQIMTAAQGRVEAVTRSFASGVKELFGIVHALTLKNATAAEKVKLTGGWVLVDPREWVKRTSMTVTVGLGSGTKESRIANLLQLAQLQAQGMQAGIVQPENLFHTGMRITEEMGYKNGEEFWTDPAKQPPQPPKDDPLVGAAKVKAQSDQQIAQVKAQADGQIQTARAQADMAIQQHKIQTDAALDEAKTRMQLQLEDVRHSREQATQVQIANIRASAQVEVARISKAIDDGSAVLQGELVGTGGPGLADMLRGQQ